MEQEVMRIYSSSPPPLDDESVGEEDYDEFGDFSGGVAMSSNQPCPSTTDPASPTPSMVHFSVINSSSFAGTTHSNGISKPFRAADDLKKPRAPVMDQSQPAITVTSEVGRSGLEVKGQPCHCDLPDLPLTNGFTERHHQGTMSAGPVPAGLVSPSQEPGFADFSAFSEPEMELEPWCCGFTHTHTTEHRKDGRTEGTNLANGFCEAHSVQKDTEQRARIERGGPDSQCLAQQGDRDLIGGQQHPQDSAGLLAPTEVLCARGEGLGELGEMVPSINRDSTLGMLTQHPELGGGREEGDTEESASPLPSTVSGSVSEEFASFGEAVSSDALDEFGDFGETIFTPLSPGEVVVQQKEEEQWSDLREETETKMLEEEDHNEEEDFGNFRDAGSFPSQEDFNQSESKTQEGFDDFDQDYSEDPGPTPVCGEEVGHGDLPLSDSFADFHSAPLEGGAEGQGEREEGWGTFGDQRGLSEGETWAEFGKEEIARRTEEEEEEECQRGAAVRRDSLQASLSIRLQRVLQTSFPAVPELDQERGVEEETGVEEEEGSGVEVLKILSLGALLETLDTQPEEEETKGLNHITHWVPRGAWRQPQDLHDAVGLGFQWGGSHSNRTLLHCLGMDTRNMLFTGQRKQPVIVPVFAASLGMLEPTKEPVKSASEQTAATAQALPGSQETTTTSSSIQGAPQPWSQFDWSYSGLGVNPLDELTTAKLEASDTSSRLADTLNHLMSTMENTTTSPRKPHRDEEEQLSEEAAWVICGLADLSFMKAKVLMFPITLTPAAGSGTLLE